MSIAEGPMSVDQLEVEMHRMVGAFEQDDFTPALQQCRQPISECIARNFAEAMGSHGAWPPHAPATVKQYGPHPLLELTGALKAAALGNGFGHISLIPDGRYLEYGVSKAYIPYAGVHQYGYAEKNIPQREYMYLREDTLDECTIIIFLFMDNEIIG